MESSWEAWVTFVNVNVNDVVSRKYPKKIKRSPTFDAHLDSSRTNAPDSSEGEAWGKTSDGGHSDVDWRTEFKSENYWKQF